MKRIFAQLVIQTALFVAFSGFGAGARVAIGTLGLKDANREAKLADLLAVKLTGDSEIELVERRELDAVLKEASLGPAGVVRAKDAVRIGALLRVDKFVLGSSAPIDGTNRVFIRLVNARTGVIEGIEVFADGGALEPLAGSISEFVRNQRKSPLRGHQDYLAIGVVQNLGVNNRFSEFPAQMRGGVAAGLGRKVTILERDAVSFLANEVRLDMAGLSKGGQTNEMQFAFWIVDGFYQSYEVAEPEVQLRLRVERVQGARESLLLQGKPDEKLITKICDSIEKALSQPVEAGATIPAGKQAEIAALEARGKQLMEYSSHGPYQPFRARLRVADNPDKIMNGLDEASRVFESILLLDPENTGAKMRLAGCVFYEAEDSDRVIRLTRDHLEERKARACDLYRETIASCDPEYGRDARLLLAKLVGGLEGVALLDRFGDEATDAKEKALYRYYRSQDLCQMEYEVPIEVALPYLRKQFIDELAEVRDNPKDPVIVTLDKVLFAWRLRPAKCAPIINPLLPEMTEKFPDLKPYILLAAAGEQTATNSAVISQFLASLKECEEHPERVWHSNSYFTHLSSTLEDEKFVREHGGSTLYQKMFDNKQYAMAVTVALARKRAAEKGLAPPLTPVGKMRLAESYMVLSQWKEALELFNELPEASPLARNECRRHLGLATESEALPDLAWRAKSDIEKVKIAYDCIGREQWATAASILESIGQRTVAMGRGGPWGYAFTPVLPAVVADECRIKAGKPVLKDPMRFEIGETPYIGFSSDLAYSFAIEMEGEALWMATYSELKAFRGTGPFTAGKPSELHKIQRSIRSAVTGIAVNKEYVWGGTYDDGLMEVERRSGVCRRLTMNDGLLLDAISGLKLQGRTLWIAYRNGQNGAIGTLDTQTHKFSALTPSLPPNAGANSQNRDHQLLLEDGRQAPALPITAMTEGEPGEMWFAVEEKGFQRFRSADARWDTVRPPVHDTYFLDMAADVQRGLLLFANRELNPMAGPMSLSGGLLIYNYRQNNGGIVTVREGLPSNEISAVAIDGRIAWTGGRGFVAVMDIPQRRVLRIAYVSASLIQTIKLTPAHAWIALSCKKEGNPDRCGNAKSGVYRLDRATIEPRSSDTVSR